VGFAVRLIPVVLLGLAWPITMNFLLPSAREGAKVA
jgi:hypothetical protein